MRKKLAIVCTHPIQYYAPVFRLLAEALHVRVFYTWGSESVNKHDPGFDRTIQWDIDLLSGYPFKWVQNTAADPGSHHFNGIVNPSLVKTLEDWSPDAILVYGWAYKSHINILRHFKGKVPLLFRGDSTLLDERRGIRSILKRAYLKWVYSCVDMALYPGSNTRAYFKKYGLNDNQLVFAPHAVDNDRFAQDRRDEAGQLRQELNLKDDDLLILFAGKFETKKDPEILIDAFLSLDLKHAHLLMVGNGPLESKLRQKASGNSNIHFLGFRNQAYMPVLYQACDIFCLPSQGPGETWGLAVNEAMACSKPIIVSDKVGCAADLVSLQSGFVFEARNSEALSQTLHKAVGLGKQALGKMGSVSADIIAKWNFEEQARVIVNVVNG